MNPVMLQTVRLSALFLLFGSHALIVQLKPDSKEHLYGLELQAYPAGFIVAVNHERFVSPNTSWLFRVSANSTGRQDFSTENERENGWGMGASPGYRKYVALKRNILVFGLHTDVWNLWIDWKNGPTSNRPISGTSFVLVLQPWVETGYIFIPASSRSRIGLSLVSPLNFKAPI
ncbi:hypothetical protein [Allomuricauda sp. F6463D]|uniref:hypothetical protein n=1 Tax=Allomuricauda sp. F6463D TaxID=2926409 RepID=UPI001FF6DA91|nr:hypothetical protein [Muricauda sp. F6463D]MCK0160032.1 hypothetical protein [Muricauda sp. F6463D]